MKNHKRIISLLTSIMLAIAAYSKGDIIPIPQHLAWGEGQFTLKANATIAYSSPELKPAASYLQQTLTKITGLQPKTKQTEKGDIVLSLGATTDYYKLKCDKKGVRITAPTYEGIVCGIATLRQIVDNRHINEVEIADNPRFNWRGFHLDCSRHFFTKEEIKEVIDLMSLYKLNRFHWHLTDDQGWRIEIKNYPKLTSEGAWRTLNNQDSVCLQKAEAENNTDLLLPEDRLRTFKAADGSETMLKKYGGFYTQDDIREIVDYAKQHGIEIIPEIDMPGHMLAAIECYDGIACFKQTGWGKVFTSPLCPGKDKTLLFCKKVWDEVCELFPFEYVHIGGDEVEKDNWKKCADCQQRINDNNLKNEEELQSWFIHEMEKHLNQKGKKMIGWDEIIEGGLSATSTVMWWRTWVPTSVKEATAHGNDVIFTPGSPFYLSQMEQATSMRQIYDYELQPNSLSQEQRKHIIGVQANLWAEFIPSRSRMLYMYFPRILALSELAWSMPERKDYDDFHNRLTHHFSLLHKLGVPYRTPSLEGFHNINAFTTSGTLTVESKDPLATVRYTTDGTFPNNESPLYEGPIKVDETTHFIIRPFNPAGKPDAMVQADFIKQGLLEPVSVQESLSQGLLTKWYDFPGVTCKNIMSSPFKQEFVTTDIEIPSGAKGNIGLVINGYILIPTDGIYTFALMSDDGSWLKIDGNMVVDNDREQSPHEMVCQQALKAGLHKMEVRYFDHNGGMLRLFVNDPNGTRLQPNDIYWH